MPSLQVFDILTCCRDDICGIHASCSLDFDTNLVLYVQGCSEQSALFCYMVFFSYFSILDVKCSNSWMNSPIMDGTLTIQPWMLSDKW